MPRSPERVPSIIHQFHPSPVTLPAQHMAPSEAPYTPTSSFSKHAKLWCLHAFTHVLSGTYGTLSSVSLENSSHRCQKEHLTKEVVYVIIQSLNSLHWDPWDIHIYRSPGGLDGKPSVYQCGRPGFDPWVREIPWRRKWQLTPVFLPEKSLGQRNLAGYSPKGHKGVGQKLVNKQQ